MPFEWDPNKNDRNLRKHKIAFYQAVEALADTVAEFIDCRKDYGEERLIAICRWKGRLMVVVYVRRIDNVIRIISARKANKREIRKYSEGEKI